MRAVRKQTPERKIRSAFRRERLECMDPATFFHQDAEARGLACIRDLDELERVVMVATPPMAARLKASELLGKAQGDFVERHEHKHVAEVRIVIPDNGRDPET